MTRRRRGATAVRWVGATVSLAAVLAFGAEGNVQTRGQSRDNVATPVPTRNEMARSLGPSDEVLMLRHKYLQKGGHDFFYEASRFGVWPWFERLGARMAGQWQVVFPDGGGNTETDEGYRLARYASFEHWRYTRGRLAGTLAGNGPNSDRSGQALRTRRAVNQGSKGGYFLQGLTATTKPRFLPGLGEEYELVDATRPAAGDDVIAVRNDVAWPGTETVVLHYARIREGAFDEILEATVDTVWPFEEKVGARPIGQWKVIHPDATSRTEPSADYDEMITMTRYASYDHYRATRPGRAVFVGGNGPDWQAWRDALDAQERLTLDTTVEFPQGFNHMSPPTYQPGLPERYRVK